MLTFLGLATGVSYAQKQTTVKIQETQARILDVSPNAYVKPLTVELKVDTEGAKFLGNVNGQILTREAGGRLPAAQAVGGAVGHNPVSVFVPCHRVVGARGQLTGYAGGIDVKRRLLALEGIAFTADGRAVI